MQSVDRTEHQPGAGGVQLNPSPRLKSSSDVNLTSLQNVIQRVNDGPPSLPSICLYTLLNTHQGYFNHILPSDK